MDNTLCMSTQVACTCQGEYFQLHKIAKIRKCLTTHACKTIVHALVTSRLDYGNAVLFGQMAARLTTRQRRRDHQHITPTLTATISTSRPPSMRPSAHHALPHCDHQHITPSLTATISTSRPPSLRPSAHHALPHCDNQHITSLRFTGCRSDGESTTRFFC